MPFFFLGVAPILNEGTEVDSDAWEGGGGGIGGRGIFCAMKGGWPGGTEKGTLLSVGEGDKFSCSSSNSMSDSGLPKFTSSSLSRLFNCVVGVDKIDLLPLIFLALRLDGVLEAPRENLMSSSPPLLSTDIFAVLSNCR